MFSPPPIGYSHFTSAYAPSLPHVADCAGSEGAAVFGCALLTSYLGLFIDFYINTYRKPRTVKANGSANGHVANGNGKVHSYVFFRVAKTFGRLIFGDSRDKKDL